MAKNKNLVKILVFIFIIIAVIILGRYFNLQSYIEAEKIQGLMKNFGMFAPLIFIIIYIAFTLIFFPGTPLTILSGILFGKFLGTFYTIIGATIGATIAFLISRYFARDFIQRLLKTKFKKLDEYDVKLEKNGFLTVLFLRFMPIFPFNGLNFSLGLTKLKLKDYIIGTFIGIIPGSFALAYFGESITMDNTTSIILSAGLFLLFILLLPIYNYIKKVRNKRHKDE